MSSLNQLISEIAHSVQQADSVPVRRAIRQGIIHARNELIRHSYFNHHFTDQVLKQRFKLSLTNVNDGDIIPNTEIAINKIKRTTNKVPRPTRLDNGMPFHSVRTAGSKNPKIIPHINEGVNKYYKSLPGMQCIPTYYYVNDYIYIYDLNPNVNNIIIESVFEYPHEINEANYTDDNNEFFLPEDMVNGVKKLVLETFNPQVVRNTNEVPTPNLVK